VFQTELKELHKNDIESKDFEALPADIKHEILTELKDAGRKTDWACINSMPKVGLCPELLLLVGGISSCSVSDSAYSDTFLCSVVCHLSHSCFLLKPFDGFTCHGRYTCWVQWHVMLDGGPWPSKKRGDLWDWTP